MVICSLAWNEKADRAFTRSALHALHNRQLNVSIRADFGELAKYAVDRSFRQANSIAIELPVVVKESEILAAMINHKEKCSYCGPKWFAGVRVAHRMHPWDEQELSFPTKAWLALSADSEKQAQGVAHTLFALGYERSPLHTHSSTAKNVFVYALNIEALN